MSDQKKVEVHDYDPSWAAEFSALKAVYINHIGDAMIGVEHVGSTSIPGLKAKPVIDIDIIVGDTESLQIVIERLSTLGYNHVGDLGITGREAFKRTDDKTPISGSNRTWMRHNLYVCIEGSIGLANHLNFRDYLKRHPEEIVEYSKVKQRLADEFTYDIDAYIDGKTDFIVEILRRSGIGEEAIKMIDGENRLKG